MENLITAKPFSPILIISVLLSENGDLFSYSKFVLNAFSFVGWICLSYFKMYKLDEGL